MVLGLGFSRKENSSNLRVFSWAERRAVPWRLRALSMQLSRIVKASRGEARDGPTVISLRLLGAGTGAKSPGMAIRHARIGAQRQAALTASPAIRLAR